VTCWALVAHGHEYGHGEAELGYPSDRRRAHGKRHRNRKRKRCARIMRSTVAEQPTLVLYFDPRNWLEPARVAR